ncbi:Rho termination factor [Alteromonas pelagimontana]|uniref:Rho termination factor n=1 Tax=Alteromonas pelagimontana TaxID=1858656 RepID=A0A6M4MEY2_9ALTE|nr:Rho termination factor N-terminal domain-containing protein [Alteromonas pelagimontana]QJR81662.1 Rho termination factor [Alteromonas pelagimontana]
MAKDHGNQIKNDETYEELRDKGYSKEKSARIANAQANPHQHPSKKGGKSEKYEDRTKEELYQKAKEVGIEGRSKMSKEELIDALRNH